MIFSKMHEWKTNSLFEEKNHAHNYFISEIKKFVRFRTHEFWRNHKD